MKENLQSERENLIEHLVKMFELIVSELQKGDELYFDLFFLGGESRKNFRPVFLSILETVSIMNGFFEKRENPSFLYYINIIKRLKK